MPSTPSGRRARPSPPSSPGARCQPEARGFLGPAALDATKRSLSWFEQVWGPTLLVLTRETPALRDRMPGPYFKYEEDDPMPTLVKAMASKMRRAAR